MGLTLALCTCAASVWLGHLVGLLAEGTVAISNLGTLSSGWVDTSSLNRSGDA